MKKTLFFLFAMAMTVATLVAQVPQGFTYQAVVRQANGAAVASQQVSLRLSLLQGSANGTAAYVETHTPTTDAAGLFTVVVGQGTAQTGTFSSVDWSNGPWYVQTEVDPQGGSSYSLTATQQLLAVPYALYAANASISETQMQQLRDYIDAAVAGGGVPDTTIPATQGFGPNGASLAAFSVSATSTVHFSRGNLQYQASTGTWRFAEHQYDYVGYANEDISATNAGWIDLFGWGTSGWNSGATAYQPYSTSTNYNDYWPGNNSQNDLTGNYAEADWAYHNAIQNGGNQTHQWRTLTSTEWQYLFEQRPDAQLKWGKATISGRYSGVVLLPDSWTLPAGLNFNVGHSWGMNDYTYSQWSRMEAAGAIFLPAAGNRYGTEVRNVGAHGYYWSSTHNYEDDARSVNFYSDDLHPTYYNYRDSGLSVRPVQD